MRSRSVRGVRSVTSDSEVVAIVGVPRCLECCGRGIETEIEGREPELCGAVAPSSKRLLRFASAPSVFEVEMLAREGKSQVKE
jgi:hypothetical protein